VYTFFAGLIRCGGGTRDGLTLWPGIQNNICICRFYTS